jgi:hypothetical protein
MVLDDEFLTDRGISEFHMFSHDYGDTVAQELIARDIESASRPKLLSVALLDGGLFPETHRRVRFQSPLLSLSLVSSAAPQMSQL